MHAGMVYYGDTQIEVVENIEVDELCLCDELGGFPHLVWRPTTPGLGDMAATVAGVAHAAHMSRGFPFKRAMGSVFKPKFRTRRVTNRVNRFCGLVEAAMAQSDAGQPIDPHQFDKMYCVEFTLLCYMAAAQLLEGMDGIFRNIDPRAMSPKALEARLNSSSKFEYLGRVSDSPPPPPRPRRATPPVPVAVRPVQNQRHRAPGLMDEYPVGPPVAPPQPRPEPVLGVRNPPPPILRGPVRPAAPVARSEDDYHNELNGQQAPNHDELIDGGDEAYIQYALAWGIL